MGFLRKLFGSSGQQDDNALVLYIRCGHCQSGIKVRIDLGRDLQSTYEEAGPYYILKKEAMDSKCFRMMVVNMEFDRNKKVLTKEVSGGEFITEEEYNEER